MSCSSRITASACSRSTNRTYAGPSGVVWDIALELHKAGWFKGRAMPVSAALAPYGTGTTQSMIAVGTIFFFHLFAGEIPRASHALFVCWETNWAAEFARLAREAGTCRTDVIDIVATGGLEPELLCGPAGTAFMDGSLLPRATNPPTIQARPLIFAAR